MWVVIGSWLSTVSAATPIVAEDGTLPDELARVVARTGLPAEQFSIQSSSSLAVRGAVAVLGEGALRQCPAPSVSRSAVEADLARATSAFASGDLDGAWTLLDRLVVSMSCLSEVVSPLTAVQVFGLRALVQRTRGEEQRALEEEASMASFEGATPGGTLSVTVLGGGSSGPWLDGRTLPAGGATVAAGPHLFQYAEAGTIRSGWLTVAGPSQVVFPAGVARPVLDGLSDPDRSPTARAWLRATVPGPAVYATSHGGIWLVELTADGRVTELTPPAPAPISGTPKPRKGP